ncbi:hypothetical protein D3C71_669480 [compost metagenome]
MRLQQAGLATLALSTEQRQFRRHVHCRRGGADLCRAGLQAITLDLLRAPVAGFGALLLPTEQDRCLVGLARLAVAACLPLLLALVLFARAALLLPVLGAGVVELGGGGLAFDGTDVGIVLPWPAITMQAMRVQFDDLRHLREQATVVADRQQTALPLLQLCIQLAAVMGVEVIAGFVEDQPVRAAGPSTRQGDLHRLAATESRGGLRGIKVGRQLQCLPLLLQAFAQVPAVADAGEVGCIDAARLDACQCRQFGAYAGQFADRATWRVARRGQQEYLSTAVHLTLVGRQLTGEQAREHALADTIGADQAGGHRFEGKGQIGKQRSAIGQPIRHAIEREGMRSHATSMDAWFSPARRGGKSRAV